MSAAEPRQAVDDAELLGAPEHEIQETVARAKQFYYEQNSQPSRSLPDSQEPPEPSEKYPSSFNAIVEMIATGQEDKIPGIRDIPLKINENAPSVSTLERPRKPWEKSA